MAAREGGGCFGAASAGRGASIRIFGKKDPEKAEREKKSQKNSHPRMEKNTHNN
jgi:hypothetical protein